MEVCIVMYDSSRRSELLWLGVDFLDTSILFIVIPLSDIEKLVDINDMDLSKVVLNLIVHMLCSS